MALTGNTVQSTYLDLVQLEQSGSGLPSHAGKEAALYDGSGAQILGRSAVRHWLDPHPDAASFAETWEFSTTGDMTQAALESAGWTFFACTAEVAGGILWLTATSVNYVKASLSVSLSGDFDILICPISNPNYENTAPGAYNICGGGVGDTVSNVAHYAILDHVNAYPRVSTYKSGAWTTMGGTTANANIYFTPAGLRISRASGTVRLSAGGLDNIHMIPDDTTQERYGFSNAASVADTTTFNRIFFAFNNGAPANGSVAGYRFLRRFQ